MISLLLFGMKYFSYELSVLLLLHTLGSITRRFLSVIVAKILGTLPYY